MTSVAKYSTSFSTYKFLLKFEFLCEAWRRLSVCLARVKHFQQQHIFFPPSLRSQSSLRVSHSVGRLDSTKLELAELLCRYYLRNLKREFFVALAR